MTMRWIWKTYDNNKQSWIKSNDAMNDQDEVEIFQYQQEGGKADCRKSVASQKKQSTLMSCCRNCPLDVSGRLCKYD